MRDYQPNSSPLPRTVWNQCLCLVRDYNRLYEEYEAAIQDSPPPPDGQPKSGEPGDPTCREAVKRVQMSIRLRAVENALFCVPEEYREGVWNNIVKYERYPTDAEPRTYRRWKLRFLKRIAENMYFI